MCVWVRVRSGDVSGTCARGHDGGHDGGRVMHSTIQRGTKGPSTWYETS